MSTDNVWEELRAKAESIGLTGVVLSAFCTEQQKFERHERREAREREKEYKQI